MDNLIFYVVYVMSLFIIWYAGWIQTKWSGLIIIAIMVVHCLLVKIIIEEDKEK